MDGLAEGDVLAGRYHLGSLAGSGAVGLVHLAEDLRLARPVAIKSLRPELARHPEVRERFGHEARAAARISHPNVVRVYDSGEHEGIPYLVMECLPGASLVDELAWGPLEPRRARRVGLDILGALDAAHRLGVVHRDVKPGNILLTSAVDGPVKVSDFGIATSNDDRDIVDAGALVGTAAYLAPERIAGDPAGPASDLYSVGVVLYEALAGRQPHEGETALALALAVHMGEAPSLQVLRPDLDPALVAVVDQALARDPAERWASAAEMSDALRAWRPRATAVRPSGAGAPHPGVPLGSKPGVGRTTGIAAVTGPQPIPVLARTGDDGSVWDRLRSRTGLLAVAIGGLVVVALLTVGVLTRGDASRAEPASPPSAGGGAGATSTTTSPPARAVVTTPSTAPPTTRRPLRTTTTRPATTTTTVRATTTSQTTTVPPTTTAPPTTPPTTVTPAA